MANVKLSQKQKLEELQAKITLHNKKKISQQDILDKCIEFSETHLEEFIQEKIEKADITPEKINLILKNTISCKTYFKDKTDDEIIYNL